MHLYFTQPRLSFCYFYLLVTCTSLFLTLDIVYLASVYQMVCHDYEHKRNAYQIPKFIHCLVYFCQIAKVFNAIIYLSAKS